MLHTRNRLIILYLVLGLVLVGCGFQLKGTNSIQSNNALTEHSIAVLSAQPLSELTTTVLRQLKLNGIILTPQSSENTLILKLGKEQFTQRNLSLTTQANSAEIGLTMESTITLLQSGSALVDNIKISVTRQLLNDPSNASGTNEELRLLKKEMRQNLADNIIQQITRSLSN